MTASSSGVRTVERGSFGPMAASAVDCRARHFWIVVGLTPLRLAVAVLPLETRYDRAHEGENEDGA